MAIPYIGEIKIYAGYKFCPKGYAYCNFDLVKINKNPALFSILSRTYGGDGRSTFGLPNMTRRAPINVGRGPGLSNYRLGQKGGKSTVTLTEIEIPQHRHSR